MTTSGETLRRDDLRQPPEVARTTGGGRLVGVGGLVLLADALWLLAAGRWGSYLGLPQKSVFVTDIAFAVGVLLVAYGVVRDPVLRGSLRHVPWPVLLPVALGACAVVRFAVSPDVSKDGLRDLAPYVYAFAAGAVCLARPRERRQWDLVVGTLLVFHATWVSVTLAWPSVHQQWHLYHDVYVFLTRSDFDIAVCGIAAGWGITKISRRNVKLSVAAAAFVGWNAYLASIMWSRAGLIAAFLAAAAAALLPRLPTSGPRSARASRTTIGAAVVLVGVAVAAIFLTSAGQRITDLITSPGGASAGTVAGRERAWPLVIDYTTRTPARAVFGVGFGPNFLAKSHALDHLSGDPTLRSPHDYEVGTYARLGIPGALLTLATAFVGFWLAVRALIRRRPALSVAALVLIAMPVVAAFGVVLEAPFGAIPYFVAFGYAAGELGNPRLRRSRRAVGAHRRTSA